MNLIKKQYDVIDGTPCGSSPKRWKLKKDLPGIPAGMIGEEDQGDMRFDGTGILKQFWFSESEMAAYPDFFHDMDTPEPETASDSISDADRRLQQWAKEYEASKAIVAEPTIGELLDICKWFEDSAPKSPGHRILWRALELLEKRLGVILPNPTQKTDSEPKNEGI